MNSQASAVLEVDDLEPEIRKQKVALLFQHSRLAIIANALNACLLGYVDTTLGASGKTALIWSLAQIAIAAWRLVLGHKYFSSGIDAIPSDRWLRHYYLGVVATAAAWGFGTYLFMWHSNEQIYLFTGLVVAGTVAGGIPVLGSVLKAYRTFALLILVPMIVVILLQAHSPLHWTFAGMTLLFLGMVLKGANLLHDLVDASIRLQLEQTVLLARVAQTRDQARSMLTELQQKETALIASEERYRLILHHSPTGILHYDRGLNISYCNDRFAEIFQTTRDQLAGLNITALNDKRILPAIEQSLAGKTGHYEGEYISTLSGKQVWISMTSSPLIGGDRSIEGGVVILEDMSDRHRAEETIRNDEARFRHMLETSPIAVRIAGELGRKVLFANRRYAELIQSDSEKVIGEDPGKYYANPDEYIEIRNRLAKGEAVTHRLVELKMPDGKTKWALASYAPLDYEGTAAILGWFYDVTESKYAEMALREEEEKMRGLFELSPLGIALTDSKGRFVEFNDAFRAITGYTDDELRALDYWVLTPEKYKDQEAEQIKTLESTGHYGPYEKEYVRKDGTLVPLQLNGMYVAGADGQRYVWSIVEDITERRETARRLESLANTDSLTGLLNRRSFMEMADKELKRASRYKNELSIMMADIDHFKTINDTHGHRTGDLVLKRFGTLCQTALREADTIGRIGGEEFAILLPETNLEQAIGVAERLRKMIEQDRIQMAEGLPLAYTLSIGLTSMHNHGANIDTLLNEADQALYQAKQEGRNRVEFFDLPLED